MKAQNDTLGFLLADVSRLMRRAFRARMGDDPLTPGLTHAQSRALIYIWRNEGIRQGSLAERMDVQPITLARLVDQLAELGLVQRRPDPSDRRAWRLHVTELATPRLKTIRRIGAAVRNEVMRGVDAGDAEQLMSTLRIMRSNLASEHCQAKPDERNKS